MRFKSLFLGCFLLFCSPWIFAATSSTPSQTQDYASVVKTMQETGDALLNRYNASTAMDTMTGFSHLYFHYYEGTGMENAVMAISPSINSKTEALFRALIGGSANQAPKSQLDTTWAKLQIRLADNAAMLSNNKTNSFSEAAAQSFIILVREGFEAMLIITALLTYLRRAGHEDKSRVIYSGVVLALILSVITAYLFATLFKTAGANREAMEGITMLIAAFVLFYVSYWLFSKREADRWQNYIKQKINKALSGGSLFALGLAAFLAVYREGAETILFYQALAIGSHDQWLALLTGFVLACVALAFIYWAMKTATFKIPYRIFFFTTAIFLYYMAFFFIGGAMVELQEAGWISITPVSFLPQIPWLGFYPTLESAGAQAIFLIPTLSILFIWLAVKNHRLKQATLSQAGHHS